MKPQSLTLSPKLYRRASAALTRLQPHALPAACLCAVLMVLCASFDMWVGAAVFGLSVLAAMSPLGEWANWCDEKAMGY